jgi:hypothetical protein
MATGVAPGSAIGPWRARRHEREGCASPGWSTPIWIEGDRLTRFLAGASGSALTRRYDAGSAVTGRHEDLVRGDADHAHGGHRLCILFHESHVLGAGLSVVRVLEHLRAYGWTSSGWFPEDGPLIAESVAVLARQGAREKPIAFSVAGWRRAPGIGARLRATPGYLSAFTRWLL